MNQNFGYHVSVRAFPWTTNLLSQETLSELHVRGAFRTSLCQHTRIGVIDVLYAHTTVAIYPLHPFTDTRSLPDRVFT
jgi:hypothetical protein